MGTVPVLKPREVVALLMAHGFDEEEEIPGTEISPRVRSLIGGSKGATTTEEDYRRHLEKKYR